MVLQENSIRVKNVDKKMVFKFEFIIIFIYKVDRYHKLKPIKNIIPDQLSI